MTHRHLITYAVGVLWLAGCAGPALVVPPPVAPRSPPIASPFAVVERDVHSLVNEHRVSRGLLPLEHHDGLAGIARAHSRAMAASRSGLSHDGFDERAAAASHLLELRTFAENVARNRGAPPAKTAVDGWIRSAGHRSNIEGAFELTGVGVAVAADGSHYFTQVFVGQR